MSVAVPYVAVPTENPLRTRYERLASLCRSRAATSDNLAIADGLAAMADSYDRRTLTGR